MKNLALCVATVGMLTTILMVNAAESEKMAQKLTILADKTPVVLDWPLEESANGHMKFHWSKGFTKHGYSKFEGDVSVEMVWKKQHIKLQADRLKLWQKSPSSSVMAFEGHARLTLQEDGKITREVTANAFTIEFPATNTDFARLKTPNSEPSKSLILYQKR